MLQKYTPPYFSILFAVVIVNILFSTFFVSFILAGVVFKIFAIAIRNQYNYLLITSIIVFLLIENTQGFPLFSLTLSSLFIFYIIVPRLKPLFSSVFMLDCLFILFFYCSLYLVTFSYSSFDLTGLTTFGINFLIDIIVVGFFL